MLAAAIRLRLERPEDLRAKWLDGFPDGGIFIPGVHAASAGTSVLVCVTIGDPPASAHLAGTVVWRRLPTRIVTKGMLEPGIGVAFEPEMAARVLFLDRLARGATHDSRRAMRYPTRLRGEVAVRAVEPAVPAFILDVGHRGAQIELTSDVVFDRDGTVHLRVLPDRSGLLALAALSGHVAWQSPRARLLGVKLELGTPEERAYWTKVVASARERLEPWAAHTIAG